MTDIQVFIFILVVHYLADFALQTNDQANLKSTNNLYLAYHVGTYTLIWSLMYFVLPLHAEWATFTGWFVFTSWVFMSHFAVDWVTSRVGKPFWEKKDFHNGFAVVGFDQILHYLSLIAIFQLILTTK